MDSTASVFRTLPLDRQAERSAALLRLVAALVVALGAIWLVLLSPPVWVWACAALAIAASIMWIVMGLRARRRLVDAARHRLVLDEHALSLVEGDDERQIPWGAIESIALDEERLVVRVNVRDEERLDIEPRYGGLGAYDLEAAIRRALRAATAGDA